MIPKDRARSHRLLLKLAATAFVDTVLTRPFQAEDIKKQKPPSL